MALGDLMMDGTGVLVILDSAECSGRSLLKSCASAATQRGESVHILGFDTSEEDFRAGFGPDVSSRLPLQGSQSIGKHYTAIFVSEFQTRKQRVTFHNGFHDALGWDGEACLNVQSFTLQQILAEVLSSPKANGPISVIVDSLSWVLLHNPVTAVIQTLHQLQGPIGKAGPKISQIIALLHQDLHEPGTVSSICHMATTVLTVMPSLRSESEALAMAVIRHRKKTGKIFHKEQPFTILEGFTLKTVASSDPRPEIAQEAAPRVDPAANLTFNLHLSDSQRKTRESVSLPYVFSTEKKSSLLQSQGSSGMIYYEPDAVDDVDYEDPDDDLDV